MLSIFSCLLALCVLPGQMSIQVFRPINYWGFFFLNIELYELFIYFGYWLLISHSIYTPMLVGCLFVLLISSFVVKKHLSLIRSNLFIFDFISLTFGDISKNNIAMIYIKEWSASLLRILWFQVLYLGLFIVFMGFSRQEY